MSNRPLWRIPGIRAWSLEALGKLENGTSEGAHFLGRAVVFLLLRCNKYLPSKR
ncbi:GcpE protein [Neisseria shayeganii 871]|uniref:GcpE protein n=1 Tax=Neisseria shayeganii 871 TaxID=1032488 RepID=G4CK60_9NEIS|nr:GcpE protein [Neisseria shayeganii 871]